MKDAKTTTTNPKITTAQKLQKIPLTVTKKAATK